MSNNPTQCACGFRAFAFVLLSAIPATAASPLPRMQLKATEIPVEASGNPQSDALLDCYAKFQGANLDANVLGPPRITRTLEHEYVLRADFLRSNGSGVDRLLCASFGFITQKNLSIPALYPVGTTKPDDATESAIVGWRARKRAAETAARNATRFPAPDSAAIRQLEGVWLIGAKPDKDTCLDHWYLQTEIEFEFRKTGGRALIYEPYDLFTPTKIAGIQTVGDVLTIQAEARDGALHTVMRVRPLSSDELQILPLAGASEHAGQLAYKCGESDEAVTRGVSLDRLSLIEPPITGGQSLLEAVPGIADADLCDGHALTGLAAFKHRFLQFELYGPVHYWVLGLGFSPQHKFEFDFVRSVEDRGEKGIVLHLQAREKGDGWDAVSARGRTYDLTIVPHGDRIDIPELATSFVRCKPSDPASAGMHRW